MTLRPMTLLFPPVNLTFDQPTTVAIKQTSGNQTKLSEAKQYNRTSKSAAIALELLHPRDDQPLLLELHVNPNGMWSTTYTFQINREAAHPHAAIQILFSDQAPFVAEEGQYYCTLIDRKDDIRSR